MSITISPETPPLRVDSDGAIRVGASQVTLETVLWAHNDGLLPDEIRAQFPGVEFADVFGVIAYYLRLRIPAIVIAQSGHCDRRFWAS